MSEDLKWIDKTWGRVWHRFEDGIANESLLDVKAGYQSSIHYHNNKWNCFISIDAIIVVEEFVVKDGENKVISSTQITPGKSHIVLPKKLHRFYIVKSGKVLEIYWPSNGHKCDPNDIIRLNEGGKRH